MPLGLALCLAACRSAASIEERAAPAAGKPVPAPSVPDPSPPVLPQAGEETPMKGGELVYVTGVRAPAAILSGETLVATVQGNLPTPAWKLTDVEVAVVAAPRPARIQLTPRAQPPEPGVISVQMLQPFERKAEVKDLAEGSYLIVARGRDQGSRGNQRVEVLPLNTVVFLHTQGGIAGIERSIRVTADKRARLESSRQTEPRERELDEAAYGAVLDALRALKSDARSQNSPRGADMIRYDLAWVVDHKLLLSNLDDGTLGDAERAVAARLDELF
ncbi:MAG: hypothetical protein U1E76_07450 [Planctomycetota bacterium]